mmetsp:Transcript_40325/g.64785  ORF Transcript_40325/g.64785 Transcript_40325/m.64785 type:complete len:133 (-) Transcript_40325:252-650(-)
MATKEAPILIRAALSELKNSSINPKLIGAINLQTKSTRRNAEFKLVKYPELLPDMIGIQSFSKAFVPVFAKNCATIDDRIVADNSAHNIWSFPMKKLAVKVNAQEKVTKMLSRIIVVAISFILGRESMRVPA